MRIISVSKKTKFNESDSNLNIVNCIYYKLQSLDTFSSKQDNIILLNNFSMMS